MGGMIRHDDLAQIFKVMVLLASALTCLMSVDAEGVGRKAEYYAILLASTIGMTLMASAADIIMAYVAMETTSIPLYILAGFLRDDDRSAEAGLKYFLFGAFASAFLLYGLSLLYGFTGETGIYDIAAAIRFGEPGTLPLLVAVIFVAVGVAFKVSAVPFHFWTPDVYEGAPIPVAAFVSVGSKAASFALLMRVFLGIFQHQPQMWAPLLVVFSVATMTVGNVLALPQKNIKRLLAYSSIAQAGYTLMGAVAVYASDNGLGAASVTFYMGLYVLTNIAAFTVVTLFHRATHSEEIADMAGLSRRSPGLAMAMLLALLSLGGIPPLAGFIGKFYLFSAAVDAGLVGLAMIGVINAIIALYYYLSIAKVMYVDRSEDEDKPIEVPRPYWVVFGVTLVGIIVLGTIGAGVGFEWARQAALGLPGV